MNPPNGEMDPQILYCGRKLSEIKQIFWLAKTGQAAEKNS